MDKVTIQVPIKRSLRDKADLVAKEEGFDSLQSVIRILLTKFANRQLNIGLAFTIRRSKVTKRNPLLDLVGIEKSKTGHISENIDEIYNQD